jgi:hypothetical protein
MNQPEKILRTLDSHLTRPTRLILYGRAALALGYQAPNLEWFATMDVDAILPMLEMTTIELTNSQLEPTGLYITHLFTEDQVILAPTWLDKLVPIKLPSLEKLQLFRPSILDLMLTKMMRVAPQRSRRLHLSFSPARGRNLIPFESSERRSDSRSRGNQSQCGRRLVKSYVLRKLDEFNFL